MRYRNSKVTPEILEVLEREASLRRLCTPYKVLAARTGLSPGYVAKVVWNLVHGNEYSDSRGTKKSRTQIEEIAQQMMGVE